jgi:2-C-methyl-D-erythritol 2,4-cyclodiphosphate synthase
MEISPARVSVKATTTEKLGFVGRGEGCEVYAVALLGRYEDLIDCD